MILGTITDLSDDCRLDGLETAKPAVFNQRRFIGGDLNVQVDDNSGGLELRIVAEKVGQNVYGYYTLDQVTELHALWAAKNTVSLVHHRGTFSVLIIDVDVTPVVGVADPAGDAIYVGTVTVLEM